MPWRSTGGWQCLAMLGWTALALSPPRARWAGAARLFAGRVVPVLLAAGWVHYLAFDLFVGAWIAERGAALGLPHLALLPLLALTFLFGPAGLLAFVVLRGAVQAWRRRQGGAIAAPAA